jgi:vacuolar-type H+-ATPase subunit C/Vma6
VKIDYASVDARARGLAQHLCSREELERWAALADPPALGRALAAGGQLAAPLPAAARAADIEQAERRTLADFLSRLARWAGTDNPVLEAFHAEQDRRSLRALLRGAVEGAAAEARLAGLLPTPQLPEAALAELAQARSPREIAARLFMLGHAQAETLLALTAGPRVDLLEVELALARALAARWRRAAARGDEALRERLGMRIDLENAQAAMQLAGSPSELEAPALFIAGGKALARPAFLAAAGAGSCSEAAASLAGALSRTALGRMVAGAADDPARLEADALVHAIAALRRRGRIEPLGSAPLQLFLARLAAHSADIRRLAWGLELGVPAAALRQNLVTPWS